MKYGSALNYSLSPDHKLSPCIMYQGLLFEKSNVGIKMLDANRSDFQINLELNLCEIIIRSVKHKKWSIFT